jgi:uncharacterized protein (TIGR02453 family)
MYSFWEGLADHNDREWFAAHRDAFDAAVLAPMQALMASVEHLGRSRIFRIHRDVRFSADKSPYKTQLGATIDRGDEGVLYVHVDSEGITVGSGFPAFDRDQLSRFREALDDPRSGPELSQLVARLRGAQHVVGTVKAGRVGGLDLKRTPRPFADDHPRSELLRLKRLLVARHHERPAWVHSRSARNRILAIWSEQAPLGEWGASYLIPSRAPTASRKPAKGRAAARSSSS